MKAISFILSGKTASFRKPDVNSYAYFTYNNIHKVALLGLLGAVCGFGGYTQLFNKIDRLKREILNSKGKEKKVLKEKLQRLDKKYPEFYEKLNKLKISIIPLSPHGYLGKKVQVFNNSVGYASKEKGGNLIVREQWLENPKWQILLLDDDSIDKTVFLKLEDYLLNSKTEFVPYLGKNDHPAKIEKVEILNLEKVDNDNFTGKISSLFISENFIMNTFPPRGESGYLHKEFLPIGLNEKSHIYEYKSFIYTNFKMDMKNDLDIVFSVDNNNYFFF